MKAKSKVLLGLIVALAMMVFAVPAFAEVTHTAAFKDIASGDTVTVMQNEAPGSTTSVAITVTDASCAAEDKYVAVVTPAAGEQTKHEVVAAEAGKGFDLEAKFPITAVGSTEYTVKVQKTDGDSASLGTVDCGTVTIKVVKAFEGVVKGATKVKQDNAVVGYIDNVNKGSNSALSAYSQASGASYRWQVADKIDGAKDIDSEKWVDIDGKTNSQLGKVDDLDGKFVRAIVTVGDMDIVAPVENTTLNEDAGYAVRIAVTDTSKITLDTTGMKAAKYYADAAYADQDELEVGVTGGNPGPDSEYTVKWTVNGKDIERSQTTTTSGKTTQIPDITEAGTYTYKVVVTDDSEPALKAEAEAVITVVPTPVLKMQGATSEKPAVYGASYAAGVGGGVILVPAADKDKALTLTPVLENPTASALYAWTKDNRNIGSGATYTIPAGQVKAGEEYVVVVTSEDFTNTLTYTAKIVVSEGTLEGGIFTQTNGEVTKRPTYTVTLPEDLVCKTVVAKDADVSEYFNTLLPEGSQLTPKAAAAIAAGDTSFSFYLADTEETNVPYVENMIAVVNSTALDKAATAPETTIVRDVVLPISDKVGYKITKDAKEEQLNMTAPELKGDKREVPYTGEAVEATIVAADKVEGLGEISNIRYVKKDGDVKNATTEAPKDAGEYDVYCDVAKGEKWEAGKDLKAGTFTIKPVVLNDTNAKDYFVVNPTSAEYNGKNQETKVTFADGVEGAGKIDSIVYTEPGEDDTIAPLEVGVYDVYVKTVADATQEKKNIAPTDPDNDVAGRSIKSYVKVGTFEITKVTPTAELYTMKPTEVTYTGAEQEPAITKADQAAGDVAKVIYYAEGSDKALEGKPVEAGVYTVTIETKESDTYAAATGEDALELGTFTIKEEKTDDQPTIYINPHVENIGWAKESSELKAGESIDAGTTGQGLRVEAVAFIVPEDYKVVGFAHVQNEGDVEVKKVESSSDYDIPEGYVAYEFGSTGKGQRVEAVCIGLQDADGEYVKGFQYATHLQNYGWQGYVRNGSFSGTRGMGLRMESIRFTYADPDVVKPGEPSGSLLK